MTTDLDKRLSQLKQDAQAQALTYRTSRNQLHQAIVDTYLWWREATAQSGYLPNAYKAAGIISRRRSGTNSPNFYPLVRLVWNIDISKQAGTVSNWAKSLLALHEEYTDKEDLYKADARSDLINFVKDSGGLGGLRGEKELTEQELEAEERSGLQDDKRGRPKQTAPAPASVLSQKQEAAKQAPALATIPTFTSAVTNSDQFVVMLGRRNAAGQIEVIGSDYSNELVESALFACSKPDRTKVTASLRLIAEALEPHALPARLEKYRSKFFDKSTVERTVTTKKLDEDGKPLTETQYVTRATKLRYRPSSNDFLISKAISEASLVTYVKPYNQFGCDTEVILRGTDLSWIEKELLNQQKLILYTAKPAFGLTDSASKIGERFELKIDDVAAEHKRNLYFYAASSVPTETNAQPCIDDTQALTWDWELTATAQWLAEFDATCATPYIEKIRGFFNRPKYTSLHLRSNKEGLKLSYWWDNKLKSYAETYSLPYGNSVTGSGSFEDAEFTAKAKDLALVFAVLPTLPITNNTVTISANKTLMRVAYSTELADYETFIPAADAEGEYDVSAFTQYGA